MTKKYHLIFKSKRLRLCSFIKALPIEIALSLDKVFFLEAKWFKIKLDKNSFLFLLKVQFQGFNLSQPLDPSSDHICPLVSYVILPRNKLVIILITQKLIEWFTWILSSGREFFADIPTIFLLRWHPLWLDYCCCVKKTFNIFFEIKSLFFTKNQASKFSIREDF